ncbi:cation-independent mannose-6-phosphate receptor-like [Dreissena polymorpha]|uniref:cation-independent mannose-6-phosphate receptor-like n=1 Tax=Dreissena polymorpha TaxID=45954 RepID=UPI002264CBA5|nr:cation-independent mannose-6-phosphate receptor-like [Dreissena polymorpha]
MGYNCVINSLVVCFLVLSFRTQHFSWAFECSHYNISLQPLSGEWISKTDGKSDINATYKINLCSALDLKGDTGSGCVSGTSVCMIFDNGTAVSAGNFLSERDEVPGDHNADIGESWLVFSGDKCTAAYNYTTLINVKCGPTRGSPKFLEHTGCITYFEWETNVLCKRPQDVRLPTEVKCYLYDGRKRFDLSPLALSKGGYLVSSQLDTDLYINVCRDINPVGPTANCKSTNTTKNGWGSCRIQGAGKTSGTQVNLGSPTDDLKRDKTGRLVLTYQTDPSDPKPPGCTSPPTTTLVFICPSRGQSKHPVVIEDFDCQYVIEWQTEYACEESTLKNSSCVLTNAEADFHFDLRPLTNASNYKVSTNVNNDAYNYFINVCHETGIPCPNQDQNSKVPACQLSAKNPDFGKRLGSTDHMELRYVDNELRLTYKGGDVCSHNNMKRQTVINFKCNMTAGAGSPTFDYEDECVYMFDWATKYACLDHPVGEECRVDHGTQKFDFSSLVKTSGSNWVALHDSDRTGTKGDFFINLCRSVIQEGDASRCDPGAAVCYKEGFSTKNLGRYEQEPTYNTATNTTQIVYINGDPCGDGSKRRQSTITFMCQPGSEQSAPVLVDMSTDQCIYQFEWRTAAACELGHYIGDNCRVQGNGFTIDLSALKKTDNTSYKVEDIDTDHDYLLNVCGPLFTPCDDKVPNAGVCQVPVKGNGLKYNLGQFTATLNYYDGMINLTYVGGSPYNDPSSTPRKSEIAFLCDRDAGVGTPKFVTEAASNHTYVFEWRTSYACPGIPMECVITDSNSGAEYDLSSLSMSGDQDNWAVGDFSTGSGTSTKYYLNVCGPLTPLHVGTGCSSLASVCRTKFENGKELVDLPDLGHVKSGLTVADNGHLRLRYESDNICTNGTSNIPYVTIMEFICQANSLSTGPQTPVQTGPCEYLITWLTSAACPLGNDSSNDTCMAKDPNSDYVFNLNPLNASGPFEVKANDKTFLLSICGNVPEGRCPKGSLSSVGLCQTVPSVQALAESSSDLDFSSTGQMLLKYDGLRQDNGQRVNVEIEFVCDESQDIGYAEYVGMEEGLQYRFRFLTSLACTPHGTDCIVQDSSGLQYDLSSLSRDTFWTATDSKDKNTQYYINVCRPINNVPHPQCPAGPIGGCQYASNSQSYNMGYIHSKPVANNGTVSLHYRNGDVCHKGAPNESHRSTTINFLCGQSESGPKFVQETDTCEYVFNWITPAACPLQSRTGSNCKVIEPRYGYQFDLTSLIKKDGDYHVKSGDYDYIVNVCGPLVNPAVCGTNASGVGACQTKPSSNPLFVPVNAGLGNANITYQGGELTLTYTEGKDNCHGKYTRQTIIRFTCDESQDGSQGPVFIEEAFNCKYIFEWKTHRACPPWSEGACAITGPDGKNYDLGSLTLDDDNYESTDGNMRFIINVCRSLILQKDTYCPYDAAACMVDLSKNNTDTTKYLNIGEPNSNQIAYVNGHVALTYTNGVKCGTGTMTTRILFMCDEKAKDTSPSEHFKIGDCEHHFTWTTSAACPLKDATTPAPVSVGNITCLVTNPRTGYVFDLSRLKSLTTGWSVKEDNEHLYEFNVCAPLVNSACGTADKNMGVCQSQISGTNKYNAGNVVSNLWYDDGVVIQSFSGGAPCHNNQFNRSTTVSFICNDHHGIGRPVFQSETDDCTYYIAWMTDLVCEIDAKCTVDVGSMTLDLSPLSRVTDKVVSSTYDNSSFYLSVCSPLTPVAGLLCPSGAGVCQVIPGNNNMQISLGKPGAHPIWDSVTKAIVLVYVNGSQCDSNRAKNFTSKIIFKCGTDARSSPMFVSKDGCEFTFTWDVPQACLSVVTPAPPTVNVCGYNDPITGQNYNFTQLKKSTPYEVKDDSTGSVYLVNMCGNVTGPDIPLNCSSSMVCRKSDAVSFGTPSQYSALKEGESIKFTYGQGGICQESKKAESHILFQCDPGSLGTPEFLTGFGCDIELLWRTPIACAWIVNPCRAIIDGHLYDLSLLSKSTGAWSVVDSKKNTYVFNVCSALKGGNLGDGCQRGAIACRKSSSGVFESLGSASATKDMYIDATSGKLVLEYGEGSPACSKGRSDNTPARTRITFTCGNTLGFPQFVENAANEVSCIFEFTWETSLACKVKRSSVVMTTAGIVTDPRSGSVVNLTAILNTSYTVTDNYELNLGGNTPHCVSGVVCLKAGDQKYRLLGDVSKATFYMEDDRLEAVYTTEEQCTGEHSKENVTSIIQFVCSNSDQAPQILHNSSDCLFVFSWETKQACVQLNVIIPSVSSTTVQPSSGGGTGDNTGGTKDASTAQKSGGGGLSSSTVVGVVATFLSAIILCILLVVFHKKERRDACFARIQDLYSRRGRREYSQLRYQRLPAGDMNDIFGEEDEVITVEDASGGPASTSPLREDDSIVNVTSKPASYHDDSDEELLA